MRHLFAIAVLLCATPAAAQNAAPSIVSFTQNDAAVSSADRARLDAFAASVAKADSSVMVAGHADASEADAINLSNRRASAVRDYLVSKGISLSRITTEAFGDLRPPLTGQPAQSRRVEINVGASSGW